MSDTPVMVTVERDVLAVVLREGTPRGEDLATLARWDGAAIKIGEQAGLVMPRDSDWQIAEKLQARPEIDRALHNFKDDPTGDNGAGVIAAVVAALRSPDA